VPPCSSVKLFSALLMPVTSSTVSVKPWALATSASRMLVFSNVRSPVGIQIARG
jgi:hypothetical protein